MPFKHLALPLGLAAAMTSAPVLATNVVASIKPVELLVRAVAGDDVSVSTLVPPGASPHSYNMKPSERRALEQADVIFWVGPGIETFLSRMLNGADFRDRTIAFLPGQGMADPVEDEHHDNHGHEDEHGHDHGHEHSGGEDPHVWLDPALALGMAKDIRDALAAIEGADVAALDANLARFERDLSATEQAILEDLAPARDIELFTYHDAFSRYAGHYGLKLAGVLTLNPELSPGARHIAEVQGKLQAATHPCLLTEPQFDRQWWRSITEGLNVTFTTWDPLATDIPTGPDGYVQFQRSIADAVLTCLPEKA